MDPQDLPDWEALHDNANEIPHNYTCPQAFRTPIPEEFYPTRYIADRAIDYIEAQAESDTPFFAYVSFPDPHHPFNPPGRYWDLYHPDQFDVPLPMMPIATRRRRCAGWRSSSRTGSAPSPRPRPAVKDEQHLREAMALTAGMITMVDDEVGRLVAALKASGQYDNTVIVFNSDHGDYLGDFSLLLKGAMPFRSVTQVPMIWSDPANREEGSARRWPRPSI